MRRNDGREARSLGCARDDNKRRKRKIRRRRNTKVKLFNEREQALTYIFGEVVLQFFIRPVKNKFWRPGIKWSEHLKTV